MIQHNGNYPNQLNQNHSFPPVMIGDNPIVMNGVVARVVVETMSSMLVINPKGNSL